VLLLWAEMAEKSYASSQWWTYKQAADIGANIRKGEKSVMCVYYRTVHHRAGGIPANFIERQQQRTEKTKKQMMGKLVEQYADGILSDAGEPSAEPEDDTQAWLSITFTTSATREFYESQRADMKRMVDKRNDLIHHFLPRWQPDSAELMADAAAYLDEQREKVLPMFEHLKAISTSMVEAQHKIYAFITSAEGNQQLELMWLQHRGLVALLLEVAAQKARSDGWTYLADAGSIARLQEPYAVMHMKER
jgi:hypothetical protein